MVRISGARRVLEIGTLGAYSTIWLARALPEGGRVSPSKSIAHHAEIARAKSRDRRGAESGRSARGPGHESLREFVDTGSAPFDLIFIDADKRSLPEYLDWSLKLSRPGTVIVVDNVVRDGKVIEPDMPIRTSRACAA